MREIEFRGKKLSNQTWVYGSYYQHQPPPVCVVPKDYVPEEPEHYIIQSGFADWNLPRSIDCIKVDVLTVGQYTGLKDKNGKKIYEWDIVKLFQLDGGHNSDYDFVGVVTYMPNNDSWYGAEFVVYQDESNFENLSHINVEVIGNIHEHSELLEAK